MPRSPLFRAVCWFVYTALIAEGLPFAVVCFLARLDDAPPKVLEAFLGMTTVVLIGFGILVAATGDRFIDRGLRDLRTPLLWILALLGMSTYFLYKQYIKNITPDTADLVLTSAFGVLAVGMAVVVKHRDWMLAYSFSRATR